METNKQTVEHLPLMLHANLKHQVKVTIGNQAIHLLTTGVLCSVHLVSRVLALLFSND